MALSPSISTGVKRSVLARNQSVTISSVLVPGNTQTVAPSSSLADLTPEDDFTMKAAPSQKFTDAKARPRLPSRVRDQPVLRSSTSISPDCRAVNRFCVEVVTKRTLPASPSAAAAMARQLSASSPRITPVLSARAKPGMVPEVPHVT